MIACSGVVFSQPPEAFRQAFLQDMQWSMDSMRQFGESVQPLFADMQKNMQPKVMAIMMERMKDTENPLTPEEGMRIGTEIALDEMAALQKPINEKATEFFSEEGRLKLHQRLFQLNESLMQRLETTDNLEVTEMANSLQSLMRMGGPPDFLELTPEQRELITKQQKETTFEILLSLPMTKSNMLRNELHVAKTDEEREEISKRLQELENLESNVTPEMKQILLKNHEDFMRVLTDAQKAKIKVIMDDMPDYIKNLLDEMAKGESVVSVLESWVPGMGVPGVNPNREAPRQRPNNSGRAFPGN
jgi:hypothetical protein